MERKQRILICSHCIEYLKYLHKELLRYPDYKDGITHLYGSDDDDSREAFRTSLNHPTDLTKWIGLLSTSAGGAGLNLPNVAFMALCTSFWNPAEND